MFDSIPNVWCSRETILGYLHFDLLLVLVLVFPFSILFLFNPVVELPLSENVLEAISDQKVNLLLCSRVSKCAANEAAGANSSLLKSNIVANFGLQTVADFLDGDSCQVRLKEDGIDNRYKLITATTEHA